MRIVRAIVNVLLVVAVVLAAALFVPRVLGYAPYAVLSGSMEPKYPVGSVVYVHAVDPSALEVGDDATFWRDGSVVTHQVYEVDEEAQELRTQGIANRGTDGTVAHDAQPVAFADVIGTPVLCVPYLGFVSVYCTTAPGLYVALGIVVALVVASFALDAATKDEPSGRHAKGRHAADADKGR